MGRVLMTFLPFLLLSLLNALIMNRVKRKPTATADAFAFAGHLFLSPLLPGTPIGRLSWGVERRRRSRSRIRRR